MAVASLVAVPPAAAQRKGPGDRPSVVVALLSGSIEPGSLGRVGELSPGILSAGLSKVPVSQTYLDISQGNRIFTSLYEGDDLPDAIVVAGRVSRWIALEQRAADAPGDIVPGLLGETLAEGGLPVRVDPLLVTPALLAVDRNGGVDRGDVGECPRGRCPPGLTVLAAKRSELRRMIRGLDGDDLLIALERAPPSGREGLALGFAGRGFDGNLTSDTTRTEGLVTATDIAPTILERFGLEVPDEMTGKPIRTEGSPDAGAVEDLNHRLSVISARRPPVVFHNALLWLVATVALIAAAALPRMPGPRAAARVLLPWLGLSCIYLPLLLLVGAALDPSRTLERVLVGVGSPLLALATQLGLRGYGALALASGATVAAYAVDVIAGSPLTALSLLGPNPAIGVRFFGIGNELESAIAVLLPIAIGAGIVAIFGAELDRRERRIAALSFAGVGLVATIVFAAGRFGADVGAALVIPVGAGVAALAVSGIGAGELRRRRAWFLLVVPFVALALLAVIDLVLGGGAHLTGSVLEAGGADDLADVAERRLRLSEKSFRRAADAPFVYISVILLILGFRHRRRIESWFSGLEAALAGVYGAAVSIVLGTLVNDSGAIVLMTGTGFLLACLAFAWGRSVPSQ